jgi:hypothetical protein
MSDTRYIVELDLRRSGDFGLDKATVKAKELDRFTSKFQRGWGDIAPHARKLGDAMDWVAGKVAGVTKTAAMLGGTALVAGATWGVAKLNAELETTKIALGAIFNAQGVTKSVPSGITMAGALIEKMRVDAQKLPGEFEDLKTIFMTGAASALKVTSVENWRILSGKAMAAAKATSMQNDHAAREFAALMEGRAGAQNTFGMRLLGLSGKKATEFNSKSAEERMRILSAELDKYGAAINSFGETWDAQTSTLVDNTKSFVRTATQPVFGSLKTTLAEINAWFDGNRDKINGWAGYAGRKLNDAFVWSRRKLEEWGPVLAKFAENAYTKLSAFWDKIEPAAERFASFMKEALQDPGTIDKLITLAELYLALKAGGAIIGAGQALYGVGTGVAAMAGWGGSAAAAGAGAAGAAAAGSVGVVGETLTSAKFLAWLGAKLAAPFALAAAVPTGVAGGLYYGAFGGVDSRHDIDEKDAARGKELAHGRFAEWEKEGLSVTDMFGRMKTETEYLRANFQTTAASQMELEFAAYRAAQALNSLDQLPIGERVLGDKARDKWENQDALDRARVFLHNAEQEELRKEKAKGPRHKGGGGGTNIQKVEIVVTSNQSPSRIALKVKDEMVKLGRNPGQSPFVNDYSRD